MKCRCWGGPYDAHSFEMRDDTLEIQLPIQNREVWALPRTDDDCLEIKTYKVEKFFIAGGRDFLRPKVYIESALVYNEEARQEIVGYLNVLVWIFRFLGVIYYG